jgi:hypothetical protein
VLILRLCIADLVKLERGLLRRRQPTPLGRSWTFTVVAVLVAVLVISVTATDAVSITLPFPFFPNFLTLLQLLLPITLIRDIEGRTARFLRPVTTNITNTILPGLIPEWLWYNPSPREVGKTQNVPQQPYVINPQVT